MLKTAWSEQFAQEKPAKMSRRKGNYFIYFPYWDFSFPKSRWAPQFSDEKLFQILSHSHFHNNFQQQNPNLSRKQASRYFNIGTPPKQKPKNPKKKKKKKKKRGQNPSKWIVIPRQNPQQFPSFRPTKLGFHSIPLQISIGHQFLIRFLVGNWKSVFLIALNPSLPQISNYFSGCKNALPSSSHGFRIQAGNQLKFKFVAKLPHYSSYILRTLLSIFHIIFSYFLFPIPLLKTNFDSFKRSPNRSDEQQLSSGMCELQRTFLPS